MKKLFLICLIAFLRTITYAGTYGGGDGTISSPYLISAKIHLLELYATSNDWDKYFIQTENIIFDSVDYLPGGTFYNGGAGFQPIGNVTTKFSGSYNGQNHTISNIFINRDNEDNIGLFGYTEEAKIAHLKVTGGTVKGRNSCGLIVGCANSLTSISYCYVTGNVNGVTNTGCIAGKIFSGSIANCYVTGNVTGNAVTGCFSGMISSGSITNSYAWGNVTSADFAGGFVGKTMSSAVIENCYSTGLVTTSGTGGGFCSENNGSVVSCFWDKETSHQEASAGGEGLTTQQMKSFSTLFNAGWDLIGESINGTENIWGINSVNNNGYPFLSWQDYPSVLPPNGNGTADDPYLIDNIHNLLWLSQTPDSWNKNFIQTSVIEADETGAWFDGDGFSPIGTYSNCFRGTYNGHNHTINDLHINRNTKDFVGLFGYLKGAVIEDAGVVNGIISGNNYCGGISGFSDSLSTITNSFTTGSISGNNYCGGLTGKNFTGSISNSFSIAKVNGNEHCGGLVGENSTGSITNSYSMSNVSGKINSGGMAGLVSSGTITNCFAQGVISSEQEYAGGFIGKVVSGTVLNCYSIGRVFCPVASGGFCADNKGSVVNCFWDMESSLEPTSSGGTGLTTFQMKQFETYANASWDFIGESLNGTEYNWGINNIVNSGYPFLSIQGYQASRVRPEGSGTNDVPYLIKSVYHLLWISEAAGARNPGIFYKQTINIDADTTKHWFSNTGFPPIGCMNSAFKGSYDGHGHGIHNLYIKSDRETVNGIGLFGNIWEATIMNLGVMNATIIGTSVTSNAGCLVGDSYSSGIAKCFTSGSVHCSKAAGFIQRQVNSNITNCYSLCNVTGDYASGFIDYCLGGTINSCYSVGKVAGSSWSSYGFCANWDGNNIFNSFWDTETSGTTISNGGTGKTTEEMNDKATFTNAGWDFTNTWKISWALNDGYPFLNFVGAIGIGEEISESQLISIYSNGQSLYLESVIKPQLGMLSLTDISGRIIIQKNISVHEKFSIELNTVKPGIYIVSFNNEEGACAKKVIIN